MTEQFLWSDSKTVLCWLNSDDPRKYHQFVAFRLGEILEDSDVSNWRWVPTKLNVADEVTKWTTKPNFASSSRWFGGPAFLRLHQEQWPIFNMKLADTTEEIRSNYAHAVEEAPVTVQITYFSNWNRLQ